MTHSPGSKIPVFQALETAPPNLTSPEFVSGRVGEGGVFNESKGAVHVSGLNLHLSMCSNKIAIYDDDDDGFKNSVYQEKTPSLAPHFLKAITFRTLPARVE